MAAHGVLLVVIALACFQLSTSALVAQGATPRPMFLTIEYSVAGPSHGAGVPTLNYTLNGQSSLVSLQNLTTTLKVDSGSFWSISPQLPGSNLSARWVTTVASGHARSSPLVILYYAQYTITSSYSVIGGSAPTIVYLSGNSTGVHQSFALGVTPRTFWLDAGTNYSVPAVFQPSPDERWLAVTPSSGALSSPADQRVVYYHQVQYGFSYAALGAPVSKPPSVSFVTFGAPESLVLSRTPQLVWADAGTPFATNATLTGGGGGERWESQASSGTAQGGGPVVFSYYHQYSVTFSFAWTAERPPTAPAVQIYSFGTARAVTLDPTGQSYWVDEGTSWTVGAIIDGGQGQRWVLSGQSQGTVSGRQSLTFQYAEQFALAVSPTPGSGGGALPEGGWYNAGSPVRLSATASGGWRFAGWVGQGKASYSGNESSPALTLSGPVNESATFYPGLTIASNQGGSVTYVVGSLHGVLAGGAEATFYVPAGTQVTVKGDPSSFLTDFVGWNGGVNSQTSPLTFGVDRPTQVAAGFEKNMLLRYFLAGVAVLVFGVAAFLVLTKLRRPLQGRTGKQVGLFSRRPRDPGSG